MRIQHNIAALSSYRNLTNNNNAVSKSLEKLSSGYRINRAGDDAAGLAISALMRSQIRGLDQAMNNVNDGISMTQTGDGALNEIHAMLERMKTLAVQSANGTYTTQARENLDAERVQLLDEIDRISQTADFDDIPLFTYATEPPKGMIEFNPPDKDDEITLQIGPFSQELLDVPRYYLSKEALKLEDTNFTTLEQASESVDMINNAIQAVSEIRASFGAAQNHLEHTHNNLSVTDENMTSAESQIRDTDVAREFTEYTKENIMYQAANSMLAQANTLPQTILSLLQ